MKLPENFHFDFNQSRVLVTGAGKGIGREIASMLHRFNAQVVALSRTEKDLQSLKEEIGCDTIVAELGDAEAARRAAEEAGKIDHLVNNAAIAILEPFLKTTVEAWDKTMAVNLRAAMIVSRVVAKQMIERGVAGSVMAVELGQHKIRVNSVNPTVVLTEMGKRAWSDPAKGNPMLARIPLRRFAECEDVASVVCFLLTDGAAMLNGLALRIDGGFLVS
jgi:NAD(P)-dependent dehydrogenase (short-subunit alcohol dehydrogenase family)